jgi:hypothetical protein
MKDAVFCNWSVSKIFGVSLPKLFLALLIPIFRRPVYCAIAHLRLLISQNHQVSGMCPSSGILNI